MNRIQAGNTIVDMQKLLKEPDSAVWNSRFLRLFEDLKVHAGIVDLDHLEFGPLDFIANILYSHDSGAASIHEGVQWANLRDECKMKYRQKAIDTVASWATEQLKLKKLEPSLTLVKP